MVLHHVTQGADAVVEGPALFDTDVLGDGDLDVGDGFTAPKGFEQRVAKAQGKQVLDRRFPKIVIDAKHLLLGKTSAHAFIDRPIRLQILPQRFFQNDAHPWAVQSGRGKLLANGGEKRRCGGDVNHHRVGISLLQSGLQRLVGRRQGKIHALVFEQGGKALELLGAWPLGQFDLTQTFLHEMPVLGVTHGVTTNADDAPMLRQTAVSERLKQRRHQLAPSEAPRAAKQDQIKAHIAAVTMDVS